MSTVASAAPRNREQKLYEIALNTCVQGLQDFRISNPKRDSLSKARVVSSPCLAFPTPRSTTPPLPKTTYPSPPQTPKQSKPSRGSRTVSEMDRSSLHSRPPTGGLRGPQPSWYGGQDARGNQGNLAVQPTATPTKISLKKTAVKIVRPAAVVPPPPPQQRAPQPASVPAPVTASPKEADGPANVVPAPVPAFSLPSLPKVLELPASKAEEDLAALFARLNSGQTAPVKHVAVSSSSPQLDTPPRSPAVATLVLEAPRATPAPVIEIAHDEDPEQRYLRKAAAYLDALPASDGTSPVTLMQNVAAMLRKVRRPLNLNASSIPNDTKRRYAQAVTDYINNTSGQADFLQMCAQLVADKVIAIDTLDEVDDLCHAIVEYVLSEAPKAPQAPTTAPEPAKAPSTPRKAATTSPAPIYKDPMIGAKVWPTQEKRDNVAGCRTVLLKGILIMNTVHKVQALVWGGKLESILVDPTKDFALVKFLTPEGCQKYFDATANGIELVYEGRKLAFLPERQPGPSSTNDVLKNCIDGEASRCIRAVDADEDWSDAALKILAEGKSKLKRELDCIKRGKTARGRFYIEFRFASIYSALNFKRALLDDVDWEHCNIQYAPDPCEVAHGVHLEDEDE